MSCTEGQHTGGTVWTDHYGRLAETPSTSASKDDVPLHAVAGWWDVPTEVWNEYVMDVVDGRLKGGEKVFDAGCGVLAFLSAVHKQLPGGLDAAGMDGASAVITQLQEELAPRLGFQPSNFHCGLLPEGVAVIPNANFDGCVCHSVFQYLTKEAAEKSVFEMLRVTKPGGVVIIADVCDEATKEVQERWMEAHFERESINYGESLPRHTYYSKAWFDRFITPEGAASLSIRHVQTEGYVRRIHRFCVYLTKA